MSMCEHLRHLHAFAWDSLLASACFYTGNIVFVCVQASAYCISGVDLSSLQFSAIVISYLCHLDLLFVLATSFVVVCASVSIWIESFNCVAVQGTCMSIKIY